LGEASRRFIQGFYILPKINPFGPSTPSYHRMRYNPFLGQYTLKSQEISKCRGTMMEIGKYGRERYDGSLREFPLANPSPRKTTYYSKMSTTKVKQGKRHNFQAYIMKSIKI
jgi:hypothetical protein